MAFWKCWKNGSAVDDPDSDGTRQVSLTGYSNTTFDMQHTNNVNKIDKPSSKYGNLPINDAGFFSYIWITWFSPLIWKMFKTRDKALEENDIWKCSEEEGVKHNSERLLCIWQEELDKHGFEKASFYRVWTRFVRKRVLLALLITAVQAVSVFMSSAYILHLILKYLESTEDDIWYGIGLTVAVIGSEIVRTCTYNIIFVFGAQTGVRFRAGMNGIIFDKLLKIRTLNGTAYSEILNTFSVDSYRVYMATMLLPFLLALPIFIIISTVYCYFLIGYWCIVTTGTFVVCFLLQAYFPKLYEQLRKKCALMNDTRVKRMREVLNSMKCIKMYGWEQPFKDAIEAFRRQEQTYLLYSAILTTIGTSIIILTPTITSVITITVYTAAGNDIKASTAFALVGTTSFLRTIVATIPIAMRSYGEAKASLTKVKRIMLLDEFVYPSSFCLNSTSAVEVKVATFAWKSITDEMNANQAQKYEATNKENDDCNNCKKPGRMNISTLTNISVVIRQGQLVGICGTVGAGKSSLMSAFLGRMQLLKGHLAVKGSVAYVPQLAWIFNGTVKDNILFGLAFNFQRYKETISCCGLETDLSLFENGDETEIGERGINLSGGQKQRVNLARAVYSNRDIYILDDPMSALDVRVGEELFHSCIKGVLKDKTVIFVTHQLQYLKHCEELVVMDEGRIVETGKHADLLNDDGSTFSKMYRVFENTSMDSRCNVKDNGDGLTRMETHSFQVKKQDVSVTETKPSTNQMTKTHREKGKLMDTEETAIGAVRFNTYTAYIKAAGGWFYTLTVLTLYFIGAGSLVFSDWWLSEWIDSLSGKHRINSTTDDKSLNDTNGTQLTHNQEDLSDYDTYFLVYIASLAGIIILQIIKSVTASKAFIMASSRLHSSCLDKVMKAPMSFFDANPAGRILNRFSKDVDESDAYIPFMTDSLLQVLCLVILSFAMAGYIAPWFLVIIVPVAICFFLMKAILTVSTRQLKRLENVVRSPLISHVNITSQGLPTITTYGQQNNMYEKCVSFANAASTTIFLFDVSMRWIGQRLDVVAGSVSVGVSLMFVLAKGIIPAAYAGLVLTLCGKAVSVVQILVRFMIDVEARFTSVERLHEYGEFLETEPQQEYQLVSQSWPTEGEIEFRNVVMRYRKNMNHVLHSVSFNIKPQEKIGVVGRTGAGKSSLVSCLFRLIELSEGTIVVDGQDISKLPLNCIRSNISTITQDPFLFQGTIRYNIDPFGLYLDDEIWKALENVHMKERILQFDDKLDVMVEGNGDNFSVGEGQLICLGRAVLRNNKIVVLDEATANIDTSTDTLIQETIRNCFADCTVITIAHRLNTVLHSDRIIVMDAGKAVEFDTPERLLSDSTSIFSKMLAAQSLKQQF